MTFDIEITLKVRREFNFSLFQSSVLNFLDLHIEQVYIFVSSKMMHPSRTIFFCSILYIFKEIKEILIYGFGVLCLSVVGFVKIHLCQQ